MKTYLLLIVPFIVLSLAILKGLFKWLNIKYQSPSFSESSPRTLSKSDLTFLS